MAPPRLHQFDGIAYQYLSIDGGLISLQPLKPCINQKRRPSIIGRPVM